MDWLYLQNIEKQEAEDRRELRMSLLISSIFLSYSVCTFPAAVVVQLDPDITKYPEVRGWICIMFLKKKGNNPREKPRGKNKEEMILFSNCDCKINDQANIA